MPASGGLGLRLNSQPNMLAGSQVVNHGLLSHSPHRVQSVGGVGVNGLQFGNRFADKLFNIFTKETGAASRFINMNFKTFNMSLEDWMSRMQTLIALYIPQVYMNFKQDALPWETVGRNAITWVATIALMAFTKNDKTSINSLFLNRFMAHVDKINQPSKVNKEAKGLKRLGSWIGANWSNMFKWMQKRGWLPKGFHFEPGDLMRATGMRVGSGAISWPRLALQQTKKLQSKLANLETLFSKDLTKETLTKGEAKNLNKRLSNFFEFFSHEEKLLGKTYKAKQAHTSGLIEFSRRVINEGQKYFKRIRQLKFIQLGIQTALFAFVIGDLVMRLVWATFAKWDHHDEDYGSRMNPNKAPKAVNIYGYRSLPARVVRVSDSQGVTPQLQGQQQGGQQ